MNISSDPDNSPILFSATNEYFKPSERGRNTKKRLNFEISPEEYTKLVDIEKTDAIQSGWGRIESFIEVGYFFRLALNRWRLTYCERFYKDSPTYFEHSFFFDDLLQIARTIRYPEQAIVLWKKRFAVSIVPEYCIANGFQEFPQAKFNEYIKLLKK